MEPAPRQSEALLVSDKIRFRRTTEADLDYVLEAEHSAENSRYIYQWSREKHLAAFSNPDVAHLIIEDATNSNPIGYIILSGLESPHRSLEFMRFVITEKGQGYGKATMRLVKKFAFETLQVNRLWLDVVEFNSRAQNLYQSAGFASEGVLREAYYKDGEYLTVVVMSILRREYESSKL